ncbi:SDR family NAD(P)-dependent oxidoreductase [Celeribacter halophilus]|uniref:NAD(P)-dependent dehydrogenase, short-chain alcohol dehydrogenase family n=1 Tax=Celeribacter halophilus TaxID=576117 RepID=A0A1I3WS15_9RHOB|nr:SDR family NAD(P)-dependent oxidoreductase [Celeribacter halophilus]PZX06014.1 NAD(P)-dependent dehydrogenase (short-subunit alcohol dehydrogenase family) [Celeribacter halophilus]SFK10272.1 NAD(P)-dependent dehydrogenase, short-chain alcohol dehydrogenase family [Celeribacter halophilus]
MTTTFDFSGRTALVTGAASGLGLAMVRAFVGAGAKVVLFDLDEDSVRAATDTLNADHPGRVTALAGSVTDPAAASAACEAAVDFGGRLDVVMNNAGISGNAPSLELDEATWRRAIDVNLSGAFFVAQAAGRVMAEQGGGGIVNTASMYGVVAAPERAAYCAAKAGVVALTKVLAIEWADRNIRVNAIAPGYVRTALTETLAIQGRLDLGALNARVPAGRLGTPEEIAAASLFLASDTSSYVTGQTLVADGGWSSYSYL